MIRTPKTHTLLKTNSYPNKFKLTIYIHCAILFLQESINKEGEKWGIECSMHTIGCISAANGILQGKVQEITEKARENAKRTDGFKERFSNYLQQVKEILLKSAVEGIVQRCDRGVPLKTEILLYIISVLNSDSKHFSKMGIWWDIENLSPPKFVSPDTFRKRIKDSLLNIYFNSEKGKEFPIKDDEELAIINVFASFEAVGHIQHLLVNNFHYQPTSVGKNSADWHMLKSILY